MQIKAIYADAEWRLYYEIFLIKGANYHHLTAVYLWGLFLLVLKLIMQYALMKTSLHENNNSIPPTGMWYFFPGLFATLLKFCIQKNIKGTIHSFPAMDSYTHEWISVQYIKKRQMTHPVWRWSLLYREGKPTCFSTSFPSVKFIFFFFT